MLADVLNIVLDIILIAFVGKMAYDMWWPSKDDSDYCCCCCDKKKCGKKDEKDEEVASTEIL